MSDQPTESGSEAREAEMASLSPTESAASAKTDAKSQRGKTPKKVGVSAVYRYRRALQRAWRFFHEGSLSHWTTTIIIAIALTIYGVFSLLLENAQSALDHWRGDRTITVFLKPQITGNKLDRFLDQLALQPLVTGINPISPDEALRRLKEMMGTEAGLLDGLEENPLPYSVEFTLKEDNLLEGERLARNLSTWSEIDAVSWDQQWAKRLSSVIHSFRYVSHVLSALLLSAVALIISNTIKLTIIARRDEVEVMRFMGATNAFIKTPFIFEGVLQGLFGAVLAMAFTHLLYLGARQVVRDLGLSFGVHLVLNPLSWSNLGLIVGLGVVLGLAGALLSLSRFLKI
ncbi:MAG: ABC transporter permease [Magnetococcales bacterium]|nr:ABC transporter permease [Magnetococcales bacterium]